MKNPIGDLIVRVNVVLNRILLFTVTDVSTTGAVVIFTVKLDKNKARYFYLRR